MTHTTEYTTNTEINETWTGEEVDALVDELKTEKNKAIDVAVQKATAPIIAELYSIKIELSFYKENWSAINDVIDEYKKNNETLQGIIIFGGIGISILTFFAGYGVAQMF